MKSNLIPSSAHNLQLFQELGVDLQDFSHTARELAQLDNGISWSYSTEMAGTTAKSSGTSGCHDTFEQLIVELSFVVA